jgi:hypothetical protein
MAVRHCANHPGFGLCAGSEIDTGNRYLSHTAKSVAGRMKLVKDPVMINKL